MCRSSARMVSAVGVCWPAAGAAPELAVDAPPDAEDDAWLVCGWADATTISGAWPGEKVYDGEDGFFNRMRKPWRSYSNSSRPCLRMKSSSFSISGRSTPCAGEPDAALGVCFFAI